MLLLLGFIAGNSTANPTWGHILECCFKAQSSKLKRLFSLKRVKRDVRAFENATASGIGCSLEPLLEGLFAQIHIDLSSRGFGRNRTGDLRITQIFQVPRSSPLSYGDGCITEDPAGPLPKRFYWAQTTLKTQRVSLEVCICGVSTQAWPSTQIAKGFVWKRVARGGSMAKAPPLVARSKIPVPT